MVEEGIGVAVRSADVFISNDILGTLLLIFIVSIAVLVGLGAWISIKHSKKAFSIIEKQQKSMEDILEENLAIAENNRKELIHIIEHNNDVITKATVTLERYSP